MNSEQKKRVSTNRHQGVNAKWIRKQIRDILKKNDSLSMEEINNRLHSPIPDKELYKILFTMLKDNQIQIGKNLGQYSLIVKNDNQ